jgi:hypothetical protein
MASKEIQMQSKSKTSKIERVSTCLLSTSAKRSLIITSCKKTPPLHNQLVIQYLSFKKLNQQSQKH